MNSNNASGDLSVASILGIIFVTLKLCGVIDWSWWWVTAPFWIPFGILIIMAIVAGLFLLLLKFIS